MVREPPNFGELTDEQKNRWVWWVLNRTRHLDHTLAVITAVQPGLGELVPEILGLKLVNGEMMIGKAILATMDYLVALNLDNHHWAGRLQRIRGGEITIAQLEQAQIGQSVGLRTVRVPKFAQPEPEPWMKE